MFTIVITTFKYRFEKYFKPLLAQIKHNPHFKDIEIIVTINGEHNELFDENYRVDILKYISSYNNTYPVFFPQFRGLSKMWNVGIIHSSNNYILMLNDDVTLKDYNFLKEVRENIISHQTSFKINGSWSHVVLKKSEVIEANFFDERLLGIGEEDGSFEWNYNDVFSRDFLNIWIGGVINHVDMTHNPTNTNVISQGKYSLFNQKMMYNEMYLVDDEKGERLGICPSKLIINNKTEKQYPYEEFYLKNKHKL